MGYKIKSIFYTLQGEGFHSGRPAVFVRFTGCNLWSGYEKDRKNAICEFCDTDFVGTDGENGGDYHNPEEICEIINMLWKGENRQNPFVVCTGGEPLLQMDEELIGKFRDNNYMIAIETNGTIEIPQGIGWICVSPKIKAELIVKSGNELKLVYPQDQLNPQDLLNMDFKHFFLQPKAGPNLEENTKVCVQYCLKHPIWKLSLQTHKYLNIQ